MNIKTVVILNDHACINGGQAKIAIQSAIALSRQGLEVIFFAPCGPVDTALENSNVKVVCLGQYDLLSNPNRLKSAISGLWNKEAATALKASLSELNPSTTIIHGHGFAKALSPSIGPIITADKFAHLFTLHEYFLACPNGAFFDFQKNELCVRKALSPSCLLTDCDARHYLHKLWRVGRQLSLNNFGKLPQSLRHVIYLSDIQRQIISSYFHPDTKFYHVPNPIEFQSTKRVKAEENEIALFVGRLSKEKGCTLFAEAAKAAGVKPVFVGEGDERGSILAANADSLITGWLTSDEVEAWLEKSRCLVFPSLLYETFGLVAYEAFAKGVPVICGNWTAASEIVKDQISGYHVASRKVNDWAAALSKIKSANVLQLSENAQKSYQDFSNKNLSHCDELITIYDKILEQHNI